MGTSTRDLSPDYLKARGLIPGSPVLVDSSALIYYFESPSARQEAVAAFMRLSAQEGLPLIASTLVWAELLEKPLRSGDRALADRYRSFLADSARIVLLPLDVAVAEESSRLRARLRARSRERSALSLADAIHLATARKAGARALLTNDEAWREEAPDMAVLVVDELAAELGLEDDAAEAKNGKSHATP
jgi:predicted nucleic acid-binding protein